MRDCYVVLCQYAGENPPKVVAVYTTQEAAQQAVALMEAGEPMMQPTVYTTSLRDQ